MATRVRYVVCYQTPEHRVVALEVQMLELLTIHATVDFTMQYVAIEKNRTSPIDALLSWLHNSIYHIIILNADKIFMNSRVT